MSGLWMPLFGI